MLQPRGPTWAARAGLVGPPFRRPFRAILHLFENASAKKRILGLADVSGLEKPGCVREAPGDRRQAAGVAYAHGIGADSVRGDRRGVFAEGGYRIDRPSQRGLVGVVVMAGHRRRGVADYGLHDYERHTRVRGERDERMAERVEGRARREAASAFVHYAGDDTRAIEDSLKRLGDSPAGGFVLLGDRRQHVSAAALDGSRGEALHKLSVDGNRHNASAGIAARLLRHEADYALFEVDALPAQAAAVAEAKAGVDGDCDEARPLAALAVGRGDDATNLVGGEFAARMRVGESGGDEVEGIRLSGGGAEENAENAAKMAEAEVEGHGGAALAE